MQQQSRRGTSSSPLKSLMPLGRSLKRSLHHRASLKACQPPPSPSSVPVMPFPGSRRHASRAIDRHGNGQGLLTPFAAGGARRTPVANSQTSRPSWLSPTGWCEAGVTGSAIGFPRQLPRRPGQPAATCTHRSMGWGQHTANLLRKVVIRHGSPWPAMIWCPNRVG